MTIPCLPEHQLLTSTTTDKIEQSTDICFRLVHFNDVYILSNLPRIATFLRTNLHLIPPPTTTTFNQVQTTNSVTEITATAVCISGDFLAPSLLSSLDGGKGMVDVLHAVGVTHVSLGNHEDDVPTSALYQHIDSKRFSWVNSNLRNLNKALDVDTSDYCVVEVGDAKNKKRVAILGLLSDDPCLYRPNAFGGAVKDGMESPKQAINRLLAKSIDVKEADLLVPLTHLDLSDDVVLANTYGGELFPVILGGHDHFFVNEVHNGCHIVKAGMDAHTFSVTNFVWKNDSDKESPEVSIQFHEAKDFEPDLEVQKLVNDRERVLNELETARLFRISDEIRGSCNIHTDYHRMEFSTKGNRFHATSASTILCSIIRRGLNADCCVINAGGIRGDTDYDVRVNSNGDGGWFTFADLKTELPFQDCIGIISVPGRVLLESINFSRRASHRVPAEEDSGFIHHCDKVLYKDDCEEGGQIMNLGGELFNPERIYNVAIPMALVNGLDNNIPLVSWAKERGFHASEEAGEPIKTIFVEVFALSFWSRMGSFAEMDEDGDGFVNKDDILRAIAKKLELNHNNDASYLNLLADNVMAVADPDKKGSISLDEFLAAKITAELRNRHSSTLSSKRKELDPDQLLQILASSELGSDASQALLNSTVKSAQRVVRRRSLSLGRVKDIDACIEDSWHCDIVGFQHSLIQV